MDPMAETLFTLACLLLGGFCWLLAAAWTPPTTDDSDAPPPPQRPTSRALRDLRDPTGVAPHRDPVAQQGRVQRRDNADAIHIAIRRGSHRTFRILTALAARPQPRGWK